MKSYEKQLLNQILNEKYLGENESEEPKMSPEDRTSFLEAVANFHKLGEMIYSNAKLKEVTETLKSVMERAEKLTVTESEHWFDNVTVSRHMKQMNEAMKVFEKTAGEMSGLQQRLESAYEDMGGVLNKYYKISEALSDKSLPIEESKLNEMQIVNKQTGKDITKYMLAYLEKKITKKQFEKLTGLKDKDFQNKYKPN
ncbi:MAG: hypothetical protein H8E55_39450 [Pelagibacterales bacterium]|nr:hypothetical protein [Pelagibacterales bacterium]